MSFLRNIFKGTNPNKPDFNQFEDLGQINEVFNFIFDKNTDVAESAVKAINRILRKESRSSKKAIYNMFRYLPISVSDFEYFKRFEKEGFVSICCIASLNHNGYVREKAIAQLSCFSSEFAFPFIVYRCADWVVNVRKMAIKALDKYITATNIPTLIKYHKELDWLLRVRRVNLEENYQNINSFIFSNDQLALVLKLVDNLPEGQRLFIFKGICEYGGLDKEIVAYLLKDKCYLIRMLTLKYNTTLNSSAIVKLVTDKSSKVRINAISFVKRNSLSLGDKVLRQLVFDKTITVRSEARKMLTEYSSFEYREFYLKEVRKSTSLGSILGLTEFAIEFDLQLFKGLLNNNSPKIRAAGLLAILKLSATEAKKIALDIIDTCSISEKKICVKVLEICGNKKDLKILRDKFSKASTVSKKFILKAINSINGWSVVGDFIIGLMENDANTFSSCCSYIAVWNKYTIRLATVVTAEEKAYVHKIKQRFLRLEIVLPRDIRQIIAELDFILK